MRVFLAVAVMCLGAGCDGGYTVEVRFSPADLAQDAQSVELALVASCAGQTLGAPADSPIVSGSVRRMGEAMALGDVDEGTYGLLGRALDGECAVIAAGCDEVTVSGGGSGALVVTLASSTGPGCPAGSTCAAGACVPLGDAGPPGDCPGGCDDTDDCTDDACVGTTCVYSTRDADGDAHGDAMCPEVGDVPADDCDDASPDAYTGAPELCNGADDDCDMSTDEDFDCALGSTESCEACGDGERACEAVTCTLGPCRPVPDPAIVAAYTFDAEPTLDAFTDRAGSHDGAMVGGDATWSPGPFGCGAAFTADGVTPYGEVASSADFELTAGAVRTWVRFDGDGATQGVFSRDANGTTLPGHLTLRRDDMDVVRARIQNLASEQDRCTTGPVTGGVWHEVIVRWGAPNFELVVDGLLAEDVLCDVGVNTGGIEGNMNPIVIGASAFISDEGAATPTSSPLNGAIGHLELRSGRPDPAAPEIVSFVLVDAANDVPLGALANGAVIDSSVHPSISIRVSTDPFAVDSVRYDLDGAVDFRTENNPPYVIAGDDLMGDITRWDVTPGTHTITATAFSAPTVSGPPRTIEITIL